MSRPPGQRPEYKVYRSRRGLLDRIRPGDRQSPFREWERMRRPGRDRRPVTGPRRPITPGRVLSWLALAALGWVLLSLLVFLVSAQLHQTASDRTNDRLSGEGSPLTGATILVMGSDQRPRGTKEPGAGGPGRADTLLLLRTGFATVRKLSILRDSFAEIPGHGAQKINAAYALGGPALTIETVEGFLGNGLEIDHVVEVSFEDFPDFIDSLGGIDVTLKRCIRSQPFGGRVFALRKGKHHLDGRRALRFARVRHNRCAPNEDDRARAARQQQVLAGIRRRLFAPSTFIRLPFPSWEAPKTVRTDMAGPNLLGLVVALITGGSGKTRILRPSGIGPGGSLTVSEDEKRRAVRELIRG